MTMGHKAMETIIIFPIAVGRLDLSKHLTKETSKLLSKVAYKNNERNEVSKETYLLDKPEMKDLRKVIEQEMNNYFLSHYFPHDDVRLRITQSWLNRTSKGQSHHRHSHANSAFSAVLYIETVEDDTISFYSPRQETLTFDVTQHNPVNSIVCHLPVERGQFIVFPSWLVHSVTEKKSDGDRISLAVNSFFEGRIGNHDSLTELKLPKTKKS